MKNSANMQVTTILRSLRKAFDALTTAMESRSDKEKRVLKAKSEAKSGASLFCGESGHKKQDRKKFLNRKSSREGEKKKKN